MARVRFAIVGTNFISDRFVEAVGRTESAEACAVFSRKEETANLFADKHGIEKRYTDYNVMLSDPNIDAVYVASPTICHKDHTVAALKAGKHVLCEKMIATELSELVEMRKTAEERGLVLLEAMRPDFDGAFDLVKSSVPKIGRIRRVSFDYCQYSSRYDKFKSGTVLNAFDPKMKNSALADIGIYPLHMCVSLFGEPQSLSSSSVFLHNGFEGAGSVTMSYGDMLAVVNYSKITDNCSQSVIEGELGSILIDKFNAPAEITLKLRSGEELSLGYQPVENNMTFETEAFCDMVNGRKSAAEYLDISEITMRLVDKIYLSSGISARF